MAKSTFPRTLKHAGLTAKLYRHRHSKNGVEYTDFVLAYSEAGKRRKRSFQTEIAATTEAETILGNLARGITEGASMPASERQDFALAQSHLADFDRMPVSTACAEYAKARKLLAGKATILDAVRYYIRHAAPDVPRATVRKVVAELVQKKTTDEVSPFHLRDLTLNGEKIAEHFGERPIAEITARELDELIDGTPGAKRTRYNRRALLVSIWRFAKARNYLPREKVTEAELTQPIHGGRRVAKVIIYTPKEMLLLLQKQSFETLPFVAVGAFAGIRSFETSRLRWKNFKWSAGVIEVNAESSKVGERRLAPLTPALAAWLEPYHELAKTNPDSTLSFDFERVQEAAARRAAAELKDEAGNVLLPAIAWKDNALRHSFCSYRLADVKSIGQVAEESGNSEALIKQHYRELVMPDDAKAYWQIMPSR